MGDFNAGIGSALNAYYHGDKAHFGYIVNALRLSVAKSMTANTVASLQSCHDTILKLHALTEIESIAAFRGEQKPSALSDLHDALNRRLDVLGGHISDKQYLLGLRRAVMSLTYVLLGAFSVMS